MNVYECKAAGYRSVGLVIVQARTAVKATALANKASRSATTEVNAVDYELTYHDGNTDMLPGVFAVRESPNRHDHRPPLEKVVSMREWGMPELPSKGSGVKVTF